MKVNLTTFFKKITFFSFSLLLSLFVHAQKIDGSIIGSGDGSPLIGASIFNKNTLSGTVTDFSGQFSLKASKGDTLVFQYTGFETYEEIIDSFTPLMITMMERSALFSEIVVVGYSSKTKKELSAAVTTISSEQLMNVTSPNVETMLQGQVAGLTVSSA